MVFLHGWGGDRHSFAALSSYFSREYTVFAPDFYGFGKTAHGPTALCVADFAAGVIKMLDDEGVSSATIAGHSFGGRVALWLAANTPKKVEKLVLIDAAGIRPRRGLFYYIRKLVHNILKKLRGRGLRGSADFEKLSGIERETFKRVVNEDLTGLLPTISCETLIVWGKEDRETPTYMRDVLSDGITNSDTVTVPGGHFAYLNAHDTVAAAINYFLKS